MHNNVREALVPPAARQHKRAQRKTGHDTSATAGCLATVVLPDPSLSHSLLSDTHSHVREAAVHRIVSVWRNERAWETEETCCMVLGEGGGSCWECLTQVQSVWKRPAVCFGFIYDFRSPGRDTR